MTPLLLILLGLTAEIGRSFFIAAQVSNAAREGALWAGHHYADTTASTSCGNTNGTYTEFQNNIICVIRNEESAALIGCPAADETYSFFDPATGHTLTSNQAPFATSFSAPVAAGSEYKNQLTIVVNCSVRPLVGLAPMPTTYRVTSKDTTFLLWPAK